MSSGPDVLTFRSKKKLPAGLKSPIVSAQLAEACVTTNVWPAIVMVPVRAAQVLLAATE
jgi:hypothetical protein